MEAIVSTVRSSQFIESVFSLAPLPGCLRRVDRLPDGRTALIVLVLERGHCEGHLMGPRTQASLKDAARFERALVVQFKPGWSASMLGLPAHELTNRYVQVEDLWGQPARDLVHELVRSTSVSQVVDRLTHALERCARPNWEPTYSSLARRATRLLEEEPDARVEDIANRLGVTARHLRRAFAENIGIGPKDFARSARLQRAVRLARTSNDWPLIAADAGYYDQSHLIADFQALIGLTPIAFLKRASTPHPPAPTASPAA
jgi:AraC-like DNA-binding protein